VEIALRISNMMTETDSAVAVWSWVSPAIFHSRQVFGKNRGEENLFHSSGVHRRGGTTPPAGVWMPTVPATCP